MTEPINERTVRVALRVHDDMYAKLCKVSAHMGIPASTIGAIALAEYVNRKLAEAELISKLGSDSSQATNQTIEAMLANPEKHEDFLRMISRLISEEDSEGK